MNNEIAVSLVMYESLISSFKSLQIYFNSDSSNEDKGALAAIYCDRVWFVKRNTSTASILFKCLKDKVGFKKTNRMLRCQSFYDLFFNDKEV